MGPNAEGGETCNCMPRTACGFAENFDRFQDQIDIER